jgi:hypothetical protein
MEKILHELKHHLPFTVFSGVAAIIIMAFFTVMMSAVLDSENANQTLDDDDHHGVGELGTYFYDLFHVFHPLHVLFSAAATSAMFWRFDKKLWKAISIGILGSLALGAVSDIIFPFMGGVTIGVDMEFHFDLIEHPQVVVPFAFIGVIFGLITCEAFIGRKSTIFSHSGHIFVSTMASILYLLTFGYTNWMAEMYIVFIIVVIAVFIPCCISDIIFPLLFIRDRKPKHEHEPVCQEK